MAIRASAQALIDAQELSDSTGPWSSKALVSIGIAAVYSASAAAIAAQRCFWTTRLLNELHVYKTSQNLQKNVEYRNVSQL